MTDHERLNYWWKRAKAAEARIDRALSYLREDKGAYTPDLIDILTENRGSNEA